MELFGKEGCPYTEKAVNLLVEENIPFRYRGTLMTATPEEKAVMWDRVAEEFGEQDIPRTFPTIFLRTGEVLDSAGLANHLNSHSMVATRKFAKKHLDQKEDELVVSEAPLPMDQNFVFIPLKK